jgi:uncharacterized membrane protein YhhN
LSRLPIGLKRYCNSGKNILYQLLILALLFSVLEWYGEHNKNPLLINVTKPSVMILIILWTSIHIDFGNLITNADMFPIIWFLAGMISCLLGDIFLINSEKHFLPGLIAFLIGQFFYIIGFGRVFPPKGNYFLGSLILILIIIVSISVFQILAKGLDVSGNKRMKFPVAAYTFVISVMLYSAIISLLEREWNFIPAILVSFGALSFYISDILNAWIRFVGTIRAGRVKVMISYHLAQIIIAVGAVLHFVYRADS